MEETKTIRDALLPFAMLDLAGLDDQHYFESMGRIEDALRRIEALQPTEGVRLIAAERGRQLDAEGWTAHHDDRHVHGELATRAAELLVHGSDATIDDPAGPDQWGLVAKHGGDRLRALAIAGALVAAEIDRELRHRARRIEIGQLVRNAIKGIDRG